MSIYSEMRAAAALDLSRNELKVWLAYRAEMDEDRRQVRGKSQEQLRAVTGLCRSRFAEASGSLQSKGLIETRRQRNFPQVITVREPAEIGTKTAPKVAAESPHIADIPKMRMSANPGSPQCADPGSPQCADHDLLNGSSIDSRERERARARENDPGDNEQAVGHGVVVNCETIRHPAFTISIPAISLGIAGRLPVADVKSRCLAHALQWAAEIDSGKPARLVVPDKIGNFLAASLIGEINRAAVHGIRLEKAAVQTLVKPAGSQPAAPVGPRRRDGQVPVHELLQRRKSELTDGVPA